MAFSVEMPALGESVTEGTVTRWLKEEGDTVEADEPLLEVSTDKVDTEIPAPTSGVLTKIIAQEDDVVEVGGELALIGDADEQAGDDSSGDDSAGGDEPTDAGEPEQADEAPSTEAEAPAEKPSAESTQGGGSAEGTDVVMPELGESVTEGTVTNWLKSVGDSVEADEPLLEVSTDKVDTEIPAPIAGTLLEIVAQEDDVIEVGGKLAVIGDASAAPTQKSEPEPEPEPAKTEPEPEPEPEPAKSEAKPAPEEKSAPAAESDTVTVSKADPETMSSTPYVTPLVRKLAAENDIDLNSIKGTGVGGRIRKQDVLAAAESAKAPEPAPAASPAASAPSAPASSAPEIKPELAELRGTTQKINRIRQITAKKTRESLQTSAQLTQVFEVDMTKIVSLRKQAKESFKASEGVNLTFLPFIAKAVVEALKAHPNVNASIDEDRKEITYYDKVHLGIAVDTEQGLLSPVIHNADDLSIAGLARAIADIAARARKGAGGLKPDELAGGTFTITNIGSQGALFDTPILVPPQAAMLGTGAIVKRPVVITGDDASESIAVRSMSYLPLTYDHRLIDGADAGRFLTTIKKRLEQGGFAADLGL
ncbi:2-oxoglutarate dehydrogenase, E2 component, dihydrolipoamide succinyltransferase [Gordonia sp. Z-3]|jgi:2-oxoglutarate dehydrogenase E2 component (dihydrolipoamide succinyltransferase)|uniref:Dihydrolipoamide acetyltransferase component of pyruvate dehydrogenase complex n=2 Tax=Gordonia TaxID=2053 RepID=A0A9X3I3N5_9ACTN|nr:MULTISPECIES: 2-oxoglutarate dehydrogenase, E2 component, dihydrolipoamide succinyltransferase [Gordonia]MAU84597.1 2-oxoglutarate dehydrogenase, E2 component, dihydrolipoamide succinyltransferase [Gordonia sp. (in: high G+C Gram-positive bacteria)]MCF3938039.1 2-oxoglutarate dehydrogenase, E2 component, dihydrolipoamide succinyltransferase [Gordonia tangerina]MCX2963823.1 2-oxoglutarate dehydrogenase, E2 component, dihydrolipoamide succinyltransferase [Gordonia aquimaris]MED5801517.1 2-oxog